jgi:C1A family cysteine protease
MNHQGYESRSSARTWLASVLGLLLIVAVLLPANQVIATDPGLTPSPPGSELLPGEGPGPIPTPRPSDPEKPLPPRTGCIPPLANLSHLTAQKLPRGFAPRALPARFDWRDQGMVSPVKDQGNCGSCYAFATVASMESRLLLDGAGALDLSENNAKECNWRELAGYEEPPGQPRGSCDGGDAYIVADLFTKTGTVLESCDPYVAADVDCTTACPYQHTVLGWSLISGEVVPSTEVLKQYIHKHGPVKASMYVDENKGFDSSYDGSYTFNYAAPAAETNHGVLIVGWSDSLPPVPGSTEPAAGWIVKNSWGTGWGDDGYYYVAYGTGNTGMYTSLVYDWQPYDPAGDLWHYDDDGGTLGNWGGYLTMWGLAPFTAPRSTCVTRVEFWTTDATIDVDVFLYDRFDGTAPRGLLAQKLNSSFGDAGYHSVVLDRPVPVAKGEDVVAVVKFTNNSFRFPLAWDWHGPSSRRTRKSASGDPGTWTEPVLDGEYGDNTIRLRTSTNCPRAAPTYLPLVTVKWPPPSTTLLEAVADSMVLQGYPDDYLGTQDHMWVGYDHCYDGGVARSLLEFYTHTIPDGATVLAATLNLRHVRSCDFETRMHTVSAHRIRDDMGVDIITWRNQPRFAEAYGSTVVTSSDWSWYGLDVTGLVQGWVDGSFPNYGIMLRGPEGSGNESAALGFATMQRGDGSRTAYIDVTYRAGGAVRHVQLPARTEPPAATGLPVAEYPPAARDTATPGFVLQREGVDD